MISSEMTAASPRPRRARNCNREAPCSRGRRGLAAREAGEGRPRRALLGFRVRNTAPPAHHAVLAVLGQEDHGVKPASCGRRGATRAQTPRVAVGRARVFLGAPARGRAAGRAHDLALVHRVLDRDRGPRAPPGAKAAAADAASSPGCRSRRALEGREIRVEPTSTRARARRLPAAISHAPAENAHAAPACAAKTARRPRRRGDARPARRRPRRRRARRRPPGAAGAGAARPARARASRVAVGVVVGGGVVVVGGEQRARSASPRSAGAPSRARRAGAATVARSPGRKSFSGRAARAASRSRGTG